LAGDFTEIHLADGREDLFLIIRDTDVLVEMTESGPRLPNRAKVERWGQGPMDLGKFEGRACFAAPPLHATDLPSALQFMSARALFAEFDEPTLHVVGMAIAVVEFETTHRFCGRCATPTEPYETASPSPRRPVARERRCPNCQLVVYPRIPPAVIVLVEKDGQILLARNARFRPGMFSALAGFVEIGESFEETAMREIHEEVGIRIGELRYFGSQPWPFGHSLMIGFFAQYAGGELLVDGLEITEAAWFSRANLPLLPPKISIARKLIEAYLARRA
jgi:NAD+ diphosphatase